LLLYLKYYMDAVEHLYGQMQIWEDMCSPKCSFLSVLLHSSTGILAILFIAKIGDCSHICIFSNSNIKNGIKQRTFFYVALVLRSFCDADWKITRYFMFPYV
jgi:hypothetical protein